MKSPALYLAGLAALILAVPGAVAEVKVGDPAPPLKIKDWVRGDPIDLAKAARKKFHLVEFWAVWCPPCKASVPLLTEYQRKFKDDLVIVGVTDPDPYRNSPTEIRQFVKRQGRNMDYTVAIDDRGKTTEAYLDTSEAIAIPQAYLVGKDGRVVWQGSPLDPSLEQVVTEVIAGRYDVKAAVAAAQLEQELDKRFQTIDLAFQMGQMDKVWDGLVDVVELDPANEMSVQLLTGIYVSEPSMSHKFRRWVTLHMAAQGGNTEAMQMLALSLCRIDDFTLRVPDLALEAASAAYEASGRHGRAAIEVYARALYEIGALDRAIALQQEAVARADGEDEKKASQTVLEFYRKCKSLQNKSK